MSLAERIRRLGWLPDLPKLPGEKLDWNALDLLGSDPPPARSDNRDLVVEVLNQGAVNSCVANAGFQAVRASHVRQGDPAPPLGSRLWGYYLARRQHGGQDKDEGTHIRFFFNAINKLGFPPESAFPYAEDDETIRKPPPTAAFTAAHDQRKPTIYRSILDQGSRRVDAVKRALGQRRLVVFGTFVNQAFVDGQLGDGPVGPPSLSEVLSNRIGHSMCLVDHEGDVFRVVNSWGEGWGEGGYCRFSADYVGWLGVQDLWIVEQAPLFSGR
jgi:hypothetical protein